MSRLDLQLRALKRDLEQALDATNEARNNAARGERALLLANLRAAFRCAAAVHRRRAAVLHAARRPRDARH